MTAPPELSAGPEQAFDAPWQVEAYAMAQALVANGTLPAALWTATLASTLRRRLAAGAAETYHAALAETLATLLVRQGLLCEQVIEARIAAWRTAYECTPHGQPVTLPECLRDAPLRRAIARTQMRGLQTQSSSAAEPRSHCPAAAPTHVIVHSGVLTSDNHI
ncbi:MAG: hypothetical protein AAF074_18745 [Pseudomonadota bacterium]